MIETTLDTPNCLLIHHRQCYRTTFCIDVVNSLLKMCFVATSFSRTKRDLFDLKFKINSQNIVTMLSHVNCQKGFRVWLYWATLPRGPSAMRWLSQVLELLVLEHISGSCATHLFTNKAEMMNNSQHKS